MEALSGRTLANQLRTGQFWIGRKLQIYCGFQGPTGDLGLLSYRVARFKELRPIVTMANDRREAS